jgi:hypothetical protein
MEHYLTEAEQLYKNHRYEEALATYEQAIRLSMPDPDPRLYYGRAAVLERLAEQAYDMAKQRGYSEEKQEAASTDTQATPSTISLTALARYSAQEMSKYRRKELSNDEYCLEIIRRAVVLHDSEAQAVLQELFNEDVHTWVKRHPMRATVLTYISEQSCVDETFALFWSGTANNPSLEFKTLAAALRYLRASLQSAILDILRMDFRLKVQSLPDADDPLVEDNYQDNEIWEIIKDIIPVEREKRVAYLLYYCGLKPRDIVRFSPQEYSSVQEVYLLKRNITERLLHKSDLIRRRLSNEA